MTPKIDLSLDFCTMHLPTSLKFPYVYAFGSYLVAKQTNTPTNKQTPLKTSNAVRYDTTLGKNCVISAGSGLTKSAHM